MRCGRVPNPPPKGPSSFQLIWKPGPVCKCNLATSPGKSQRPLCVQSEFRCLKVSTKVPHKRPIMSPPNIPMLLGLVQMSPSSIWSPLLQGLCLCNIPRIKIYQFSQKNTPKTLALARTKRLNQHYKFLAEFQNTWQMELQSSTPPLPPSFLAMVPSILSIETQL